MTADLILYVRYFLEYAMIIPGACFTLGLMRRGLRHSFRRTAVLTVLSVAAAAAAGALISVITEVPSNIMIELLMIPYFIIACRSCTYSWNRLLFIFLLVVMLGAWACTCSGYFFIRMETANPREPFSVMTGVACLFLFSAVLLLFYVTFRDKIPHMFEMEQLDRAWGYAFYIPLIWVLIFILMMPDYADTPVQGHHLGVILGSLTAIVCLLYGLLQMMWYIVNSMLAKEKLRQENLILKMEEARYQSLQKYTQNTRTQRHNFRQHLRVITQLAAENEMGPLRQYLSEFTGTVGTELEEFCKNPSVDAIAAWYHNVAQQQNTQIRWSLHIPENLPLSNNDLCMILGNLLENALRVTSELPEEERVITAQAQMIGEHMLGIIVSNPYRGIIPLDESGLPIRVRGEGIGLRSISDLVSSLNGNMLIETDNGQFTVNILINIED